MICKKFLKSLVDRNSVTERYCDLSRVKFFHRVQFDFLLYVLDWKMHTKGHTKDDSKVKYISSNFLNYSGMIV